MFDQYQDLDLNTPANGPLNAGYGLVHNRRQAEERIRSCVDLPTAKRQAWLSALKFVAGLKGLPPDCVPLNAQVVREVFAASSPAAARVSIGRWNNIRSDLKAAMIHLGILVPDHGPAAAEWAELLRRLDPRAATPLSRFAQACSSWGVSPTEVDGAVIKQYEAELRDGTICTLPSKRVAQIRRTWNHAARDIEGWPPNLLPAPDRGDKAFYQPLSAFAESFQRDVARFAERLSCRGRMRMLLEADPADLLKMKDQPRRPLKDSTLAGRVDHLRWAASALVATGTPIEDVTSICALVTPVDRVQVIMKFLFERAGEEPSTIAGHVSHVLRIVARYEAKLPPEEVKLISIYNKTFAKKYEGITDKNLDGVMAALQPSAEMRLKAAPRALMATAARLRQAHPRRAYSRALEATLLELLLRRPIRLGNLRQLRLDMHLLRDDPRGGAITRLQIGADETKNNRPILMRIVPETANILERWIRDYRPLSGNAGSPFLFPGWGDDGQPLTPQSVRDRVKAAAKRCAGLKLSPHQFRHLAGAQILEECPGEIETVRQLLGHKSIMTTIRAYTVKKTEEAGERFDLVFATRRDRGCGPSTDEPTPKRPKSPRGKPGAKQ